MRIMVDATALLLRSAGVKNYLYHWIQALTSEAGDDHIDLYPPMPAIGALNHQHSVASPWATRRGIAMAVGNLRLGLPFPQWCARHADVFHCSNQVRTPPRSAKLTATLYDVTCTRMPELHSAANVKADRRFVSRVLSRADGLIAISEHTRRDAIEYLGLKPERIHTIPCGISQAYFDARPQPNPGKPYVLSVGTIEPRKNIDRLLDAWQQLSPDLRAAYDLVLAGPAGWAAPQTIARLRSAPPGVRWLGYVGESELPALTAGATLLAYPSLYEGFGLPLAQAMAAGVCALTSNVSSLPEVAGEAARLVDPLSVNEIRAALQDLLENPDERRRRGAAGRTRALELYRWPLVARRSLQFFHSITAA